MNVNDMVAALAAKTVDAMVNVEPYNAIAEADGIGNIDHGLLEHRQDAGVHGGDARTSSQKNPDTIVAYLQGVARSRARLQGAARRRWPR